MFADCENLLSVSIPDSVTSINFEAFRFCMSLASLTIPDSVIEIEEGAFEDCSDAFTIHARAGSCAEAYAKENNLRFKAL